jgi:hypothetical protein
MRTFPKELATFREMVKERAARLRQLSFAELIHLADQPVECVMVERRKGTIGTIVLSLPSGGIQIVLQGFLEHRIMPEKSVALDGFYKYPDETTAPMTPAEFWDFD